MRSDSHWVLRTFVEPFMGDLFDWKIGFAKWVGLVLLQGAILWTVAYYMRRRHVRSLEEREAQNAKAVEITNFRHIPEGYADPVLVVGNVVLGHARVRGLSILLRRIFGGNIGLLEDLVARARREAILRLIEEAQARGAALIVNLRFQSFAIGIGENGAMGVEILASGTAVRKAINGPFREAGDGGTGP
ncbi:MAG: hypothetical protein Tsb008_23290 [Rhodothalassiaceae bacterium]